jgi:hypothetical protein
VKVRHGHRPPGAGRALSRKQEREGQRLIRDPVSGQLKMNSTLWTGQAVGELIADRFAIRLAARAVCESLKRRGFTPQRPLKKACEQSSAAAAKWVNEACPKIAKAAPAGNRIALTRATLGALRSIQKQPERAENYFGRKDAWYAALCVRVLRSGFRASLQGPRFPCPDRNRVGRIRPGDIVFGDIEGVSIVPSEIDTASSKGPQTS